MAFIQSLNSQSLNSHLSAPVKVPPHLTDPPPVKVPAKPEVNAPDISPHLTEKKVPLNPDISPKPEVNAPDISPHLTDPPAKPEVNAVPPVKVSPVSPHLTEKTPPAKPEVNDSVPPVKVPHLAKPETVEVNVEKPPPGPRVRKSESQQCVY